MLKKKISRIGILHSLTGTMSISEKPLVDLHTAFASNVQMIYMVIKVGIRKERSKILAAQ